MSLESLGMIEQLDDLILVHHVCHNLDHSTREAWENSLGSSHDYPPFKRLEEFLNSRVRALERIEAAAPQQPHSKPHPEKKSATAHHGATQQGGTQPEQRAFSCDCCKGTHFIVSCPNFRNMDVTERRNLVKERRLCYNCMGRHSANACKSTHVCKTCAGKHHTMLHEQQSRPTTTQQAPAPQPSTSAAPH